MNDWQLKVAVVVITLVVMALLICPPILKDRASRTRKLTDSTVNPKRIKQLERLLYSKADEAALTGAYYASVTLHPAPTAAEDEELSRVVLAHGYRLSRMGPHYSISW